MVKNVKNIFFDLCEVFINGMYWGGEMGRLVEQRFGIPVDEFKKKDSGESWELWKKLNRGEIKEDEYWQKIVELNSWNVQPEDFIQCTRDALKVEIPGTLQLATELKRKGYRLFLVSDLWNEMRDAVLAAHPWIPQLFEKCYFSCDFSQVKSEPDYFEKICKDAGVDPAESLFVDDYDVNVDRAKGAGMQGIVFKTATQLSADLKMAQ